MRTKAKNEDLTIKNPNLLRFNIHPYLKGGVLRCFNDINYLKVARIEWEHILKEMITKTLLKTGFLK